MSDPIVYIGPLTCISISISLVFARSDNSGEGWELTQVSLTGEDVRALVLANHHVKAVEEAVGNCSKDGV